MLHTLKQATLPSIPYEDDSGGDSEKQIGETDQAEEDDDIGDSDEMLDLIISEEKKTFKKLEQLKKRRKGANTAATSKVSSRKDEDDLVKLCKKLPFDKEVSYSLLDTLIEEDEAYLDESLYLSNRIVIFTLTEN